MKTASVIVLPYNKEWKSDFEKIKNELEAVIGDLIVADDEGNIIYVWSNDDNYSTYTRITFVGGLKRYNEIFAESFTANDDIIEVFSEFMNL